jgi:uncharacterized iron-regulated protein
MRLKLVEDILGVEIPRIIPISEIIRKISDKKVIYVGESHDRFEHHRVQLEIIRELHRMNGTVAVAMEMFQKPFQQALDDYITGKTDEKEFLKKSEYFKRWGIDYNLYREILLYAREYQIPVIGLNIDREIVSKVSKNGLQSLTEEEMNTVPEYVDLSDAEYRTRLRDFFEQHGSSRKRNFDFFYQAQVLWDESMSHNLNSFMKDNPNHQVIVIAGSGHMAFGSGIPKRTFRLNQEEYAVILNNDSIKSDIADFVLFPAPVSKPASQKLMVFLKKEEDKVKIADFSPNSISEEAGLKKGDFIIAIDNAKIRDIDDIKISLLDKKSGDSVTVKVLRKRFLFGKVEKEFAVKF